MNKSSKCLLSRVAVYAGTFDPVTNGHLDIIERASTLYDELIVAVVRNASSQSLFSYEERIEMMQSAVDDIRSSDMRVSNIVVEGFSGLLVDYVREKGSKVIIRGLRAVSDYEYEAQMALMNRKIANDIETVFLMTSENQSSISSSMAREVARHGGNVAAFVPRLACTKLCDAFIRNPIKIHGMKEPGV